MDEKMKHGYFLVGAYYLQEMLSQTSKKETISFLVSEIGVEKKIAEKIVKEEMEILEG